MRLTFLSVSAAMGGSEVSLLTLIRGLRAHVPEWALDLVVPREGPLMQAAIDSGARAHVLPFPPAFSRVGEVSSSRPATIVARGASLLLAAGGVARYGRELSRLLASISPDV